jgi:hypothetical protein
MNYKPPDRYFKKVFLIKLATYQIWENVAIERIVSYLDGKYYLKHTNNDYRYDFELSSGKRYEVKFDAKASETGNVYVEFLQFNKNSGIRTTQADFYIIIIPRKVTLFLLVSVTDIEQLIKSEMYKRIIQPNSTNYYTAGYIFDVELIKQISTEL